MAFKKNDVVAFTTYKGNTLYATVTEADENWITVRWHVDGTHNMFRQDSESLRRCDHNRMVENGGGQYAWRCADCGYVYGKPQ